MTSDGLHRRPRIPHEWAVQYTNNILTHYADFTKCQTDTKYKQDPNQTVLNKVLCMLKRKPYDALWCLSTQSSLNLIMQQYWTSMNTTGNLGFLALQMIKCCHLWKMQYSQTSQSCGFLASLVPISLIWIHHILWSSEKLFSTKSCDETLVQTVFISIQNTNLNEFCALTHHN